MAKGEKTLDVIKKSLLEQLAAKNAKIPHFICLVDDYLFYCQQEKKKQAAARAKKDDNATQEAVMCNKQKLAILKQMGLNTDNCTAQDDEL